MRYRPATGRTVHCPRAGATISFSHIFIQQLPKQTSYIVYPLYTCLSTPFDEKCFPTDPVSEFLLEIGVGFKGLGTLTYPGMVSLRREQLAHEVS